MPAVRTWPAASDTSDMLELNWRMGFCDASGGATASASVRRCALAAASGVCALAVAAGGCAAPIAASGSRLEPK